jgi:hypothetical protein
VRDDADRGTFVRTLAEAASEAGFEFMASFCVYSSLQRDGSLVRSTSVRSC